MEYTGWYTHLFSFTVYLLVVFLEITYLENIEKFKQHVRIVQLLSFTETGEKNPFKNINFNIIVAYVVIELKIAYHAWIYQPCIQWFDLVKNPRHESNILIDVLAYIRAGDIFDDDIPQLIYINILHNISVYG